MTLGAACAAVWLIVGGSGFALAQAAAHDPPPDDIALALAYIQAGSLDQARDHLQRRLRIQDTAELRSLLGNVEEKAGRLMAAAEEYQRAAHMDPTEGHLFDWGDNLLQLRAYAPASEVLTEAVRRYPRSARLHVGLGIARYSRGQYPDAVRSFCTAADLDPGDARPYVFLGEMYGVAPELADEVTRRLALFVSVHPTDALGQYHYAMSLWKGRPGEEVDLAEVEKRLEAAVKLDPALAKAHFQIGVFRIEGRRYPEAIAALQTAVRLEPGMAQAHYRLGQLHRRLGQEELAREELAAFERLRP